MGRLIQISIESDMSAEAVTALVPDYKEAEKQLARLGIGGATMYDIKKAFKKNEPLVDYDLGDAYLTVEPVGWWTHAKMTVRVHVKSFYIRWRTSIWNRCLIFTHKLKKLFRRSHRS